MGTPNKVKFGLCKAYYAVLTETAGSAPSWGAPVAIPGAVSLTLSPEGSRDIFDADNRAYYMSQHNSGYTGTLEVAAIPDSMLKDVWGFGVSTTDKVMSEDAGTAAKPFALLFETNGDATDDLFVFYRCYAERPEVSGATTTSDGGAEVQTQTIELTAMPVIDDSAAGTCDGKVFARTTADTTSTVVAGWFSAVYDDFA